MITPLHARPVTVSASPMTDISLERSKNLPYMVNLNKEISHVIMRRDNSVVFRYSSTPPSARRLPSRKTDRQQTVNHVTIPYHIP